MNFTDKRPKKNYLQLDTPLQFVKGVGPDLAQVFKKKSLSVVAQLIHWLPRGYQDNRVLSSLREIVPGKMIIVRADLLKKNIIHLRGGSRKIYEIVLGEGPYFVSCKFFKLPYKTWFNNLRIGDRVELRGKAVFYRNRMEFHHPQIFPAGPEEEKIDGGGKEPVSALYSEIDSISQNKLRAIIQEIFKSLDPACYREMEWLPEWMRKKYQLLSISEALRGVHFPDSGKIESYLNFKTAAQQRLIFDEFFELQLYFALKNEGWKSGRAVKIPIDRTTLKAMEQSLPFALTSAQKKVLETIFSDLNSSSPMHRLLQGDVGCGKTVVALMSALACAKAGFQTAIMAPTEILARQHYKNALKFLEPFGLKVELLTGKMKLRQKRAVTGALRSGFCPVCVGTQALIQENVEFHRLAFVVIDEQHRFGAEQRAILKSKGQQAHFLVMTATPIPRTLSLALYGDLDISVIDEMPPGRIPVLSRRVFPQQRKEVFDFLRTQIKEGRQGYVVYPLVEESEALDLKNATEQYEKLKSHYSDIQWGLLTGRMSPEEKQSVMDRFVEGEIQALVSTTVIEVGVDVPNASVMLIENAERFGLSQMHQLRGRVGRGQHKSYCVIALGEGFSKEASQRAYIMQKSSNGFEIAEKDLEIRGPGEFLGSRQSGLPGFKTANLIRDAGELGKAKSAAFDLISKDPGLKDPLHEKMRIKFKELSSSVRPG